MSGENPARKRGPRVGLGRTTRKLSKPVSFQFHDPAIAAIAAAATAVDATMMARTGRDYHAEYVARTARRAERGLTLAEARGHGTGARGAVQLSGWVTSTSGERRFVAATGPAAVARLAARLHDERHLASGRMSPSVFADRWRGRQVGGVRVSARSAVVNASLHRAGAETEVRYLRGARK